MMDTEPRNLKAEIAATQVVVLAGGKAKRMGIDIPKCMLEIGGNKLIDRCIESLKGEGFRKFVFLLGHKSDVVIAHVGDGSKYGIEARYSIDPVDKTGWGKGKALKQAIQNGIIERSRCIVVFPDDIILEDNFYSKFLLNHIEALSNHGVLASIILVPGTEYPYGVATLDNKGKIVKFTEKPFITKPTSIGIYAFEPEVYEIVDNAINLDPVTVELESVILPLLAEKQQLNGFFIESDKWLPVNTMKEYAQAAKILTTSQVVPH